MILDAFLDVIKDCAISLPFLFGVYLLIEALERKSSLWAGKLFKNSDYYGPVLGSLLGLIPQCGFSAAMSNLYVSGVIGVGTLISVFLATSDEAVLIMLGNPGSWNMIWQLLLTKLIIGIVFGYILNLIFRKKEEKYIGDICQDGHCGCEHSSGIVVPALIHTGKIALWLFGISFALNIIIGLIGEDTLKVVLGGNLFIQPMITALFGLIPNCAVSVALTELYLAGSLSFASTVAGLATGAGLGLIVLFKSDRNKKECIKITALLYVCAAISGLVLNLF